MKLVSVLVLLFNIILIQSALVAQVSYNVTLLDNWQQDSIIANNTEVRYNDCWGYTQNGQEFALLGSTEGTHFFQIVENKLIQKDFLHGNYVSKAVIHRDLKTYLNFAYLVCDEGPSKLQIVDLSYLPDSVHLVAEHDTNFGRVHNLFIDQENALLYACMVTPIVNENPTNLIPMRVFSLADPLNPVLVYQGPNDINEVHDCHIKDNIAILNCGFDGVRVYDFENPSAPQFIQEIGFYQDQGYSHQGWLTPDGTRFVWGDESPGKRLKMAHFSASNQLSIKNYFGTNYENQSVPHNIMTDNHFAFVAYYDEGLRIYDIRKSPKEIAFYDTYLVDDLFNMNGAWGVYCNLPSKRILVSDRHNGLFLLDFNRNAFKQQEDDLLVYPTLLQSGETITIQLEIDLSSSFRTEIYALNGDLILEKSFQNQSYGAFELDLPSGVYFLKVIYTDYLGDEIIESRKVVIRN